jgi:sialate O-acetylesterase
MTHRIGLGSTLTCLALLCVGAPLRAEVVPALVFGHNAVLQRDKPIPVWGTADAGEKVSVAFADHTATTTADASGWWRVDLPALPANATPADLVITGRNTITCTNVVVGDVWLASGQSNMEWPVKDTYDAALDVPGSARFPLIRHLRVDYQVSETPLTTASGSWKVAGPGTTGEFTAVGYYFALGLHEVLGVPIGILHSSRGASVIQAWVDPATLASEPAFAHFAVNRAKAAAEYPQKKAKLDADIARWEAEKAAAHAAKKPFTAQRPSEGWGGLPGGPHDQGMPSGLFNGMIQPLLPCALRGAIWYQGEGNVGSHGAYGQLFPALITGWRAHFGQGDLPFYWVQLAAYEDPAGTRVALLREAQGKALALPQTGQALGIDVGDSANIHPGRKQAVGRRLARVALAGTYGQLIIAHGPTVKAATREGPGFRITYTTSGGRHRLLTVASTVEGFELAGQDRVFKPARAVIDKDQATVLVTSPDVPDPAAVRYAWRDFPDASLYNRKGLPAVPFRSDDWEK